MIRLAFLVLLAACSVWAFFFFQTPEDPMAALEIQDSEVFEEAEGLRAADKYRGPGDSIPPSAVAAAAPSTSGTLAANTEETYDDSEVRPLRGIGGGHYGKRGGRGGSRASVLPQFALEIASEEIGVGEERSSANPIRHGSPSRFDPKAGHVLGEVDSRAIYRSVPEFQRIAEEGIERGTALWARLMKETTQTFKNALRAAASEHGTPLIIEQGRRGEIGLGSEIASVNLTEWCVSQIGG